MNWQSFIQKIEKDFRISAAELEKRTSLSRSVIYNIKRGVTLRPRQTTIKCLEECLDIKIDDSDLNRIKYTQNISHKNLELFNISGNEFPIVSHIVGNSEIFHPQNIIGTITLPYQNRVSCFAIMASEKLDGQFSRGDKLLVDMEAQVESGALVACRLRSSEQFVRYFRRLPEEWVQFYTDNCKKDPVTVKEQEIEAMYKVVFFIKYI